MLYYTGEDLHIFSFTKAGTSMPHEPCETPPFGGGVVSRKEEKGGPPFAHFGCKSLPIPRHYVGVT